MSNRIELIGKVISGNASEVEIRELNSWISESADHQKIYDEQLLLWQFLGKSEKKIDPAASDVDAAWARFNQKKDLIAAPVPVAKIKYLRFKIAAAIVVLLAVGSLATYMMYADHQINPKQNIAKVDPKINPNPEPPQISKLEPQEPKNVKYHKSLKRKDSLVFREVIMPDSSQAILSGNSMLKFLNFQSDQPRIASLSGAGFFNIKPADQDFILETEEITIRVQGTKFSVKTATEEKHYIEISVEDGFMEVAEKANPSNKITVTAQQSYIYDIDTHQFKQVNFDSKSDSRWKKFVNKINNTFKVKKKDRKKNKNN